MIQFLKCRLNVKYFICKAAYIAYSFVRAQSRGAKCGIVALMETGLCWPQYVCVSIYIYMASPANECFHKLWKGCSCGLSACTVPINIVPPLSSLQPRLYSVS